MYTITFIEGYIERFHSRDQHLCKLLEQKKAFTGFVSNANMGVVSLFRNWPVSLAAMASCENAPHNEKPSLIRTLKRPVVHIHASVQNFSTTVTIHFHFFRYYFQVELYVFCTSFLVRSMTHVCRRITCLSASLPSTENII